jgi:hypothetical protein
LLSRRLGSRAGRLSAGFGSSGPYNPMRYKNYYAPREFPT